MTGLPCVGRDRELGKLGPAFERLGAGRGGLVFVTGAAGTGKSTLLHGIEAALAEQLPDAVSAWGRGDPSTGASAPFAPWRDVLNSLTGVTVPAASGKRSAAKGARFATSARGALMELAPDLIELLVPGVGLLVRSASLLQRKTVLGRRVSGWLGVGSGARAAGEAGKHQLMAQFVAAFERLTAEQPVVVLLEDVHCVDGPSIALAQDLADRLDSLPLLLVCSYRSREVVEPAAALLRTFAGHDHAAYIDLDQALDERGLEFTQAFVQARVPGMGEAFVGELHAKTGGNALFVDELVGHLCARGYLAESADGWRSTRSIDWSDLPAVVEGVIGEQIAALDDDELSVLRAAAIEGEQFTVEAVAEVLDRPPREVVGVLSRSLQQRHGLVEAVGTETMAGNRISTYRFGHVLVRDHVYGSIDLVERAYLHEAVGDALERLSGDQRQQWALRLAQHFGLAAQPARSADYLEFAANQALAVCAFAEALTHARAAIDAAADLPRLARLRRLESRLLGALGELEEAEAAAHAAVELGRSTVPAGLAEALVDHAFTLSSLRRLDEADAAASEALEKARDDSGDPLLGVRASLEVVRTMSMRGRHQQSLDMLERTVAELDDPLPEDHPLTALVLEMRGWRLKELGRNVEARAAFERNIELIEAQDNPNWSHVAQTHNSLADLCINEEDYAGALQHLEIAVDYWSRFGQRGSIAIAYNNLANVANRQNKHDEALAHAERCHQLDLEVLGADHADIAFSLTCIGEACIGLGRYSRATEVLEQATQLRERHVVPPGNLAWSRWLLARALWESDRDRARARALLGQVQEVYAELGDAVRTEREELRQWLEEHDVDIRGH